MAGKIEGRIWLKYIYEILQKEKHEEEIDNLKYKFKTLFFSFLHFKKYKKKGGSI